MKSWEPNKEFVFERFDGYWGPQPKLKTAIVKYVKEWSTRKLMLQNGDADRVRVDNPYVPEVKDMEGLDVLRGPAAVRHARPFSARRSTPPATRTSAAASWTAKGIPPDFFTRHQRAQGLSARL